MHPSEVVTERPMDSYWYDRTVGIDNGIRIVPEQP
jgi:hypothetical protein